MAVFKASAVASLASAAIVALAACSSAPQTGMRTTQCSAAALGSGVVPANGILDPQVPGSFSPIPLDQVQILDPQLARNLMVQSAMKGPTATGTLGVQARFVNCQDKPVQLDARTHFISPAGGSKEPVTAWKRVYVPARGLGVYEDASAGTVQAEKFLIEVREGE
jgi:hypothetical protein